MEEKRRGPRLQIRLGGLMVLVIIALVFFKVDIKEKIQSERFQQNIECVKGYVSDFWEKLIAILGNLPKYCYYFFAV